MPCWQINTVPVSFKRRDLLQKAIDACGFNHDWVGDTVVIRGGVSAVSIDLIANKATYAAPDVEIVNKLKRAYSKEVLRKAAQKNSWQMEVAAGSGGIKGVFRKGK